MNSDQVFEFVENDEDYGSYYKAPTEKVEALKKAVSDLYPYLKITTTEEIDPEIKHSIRSLVEGCGWSSSSLDC